MERLSRTAFQCGSCRLFVWRRCSPVQQMSAHRSVLQAALLRQSLIARFGACIEGFAHLDSTQTRMAHSSVCCSSSASSLRSYDPPNPSVERSFAKSRSARSLQALYVTVKLRQVLLCWTFEPRSAPSEMNRPHPCLPEVSASHRHPNPRPKPTLKTY